MILKEFENWALNKKSVGNPPPQNNSFEGQCVSLVQQYLYKVFGKTFKAYGNAKDWATNYPKHYFKKVTGTLQAGDVLVYGSNYGKGYGHIAIVSSDKKFFDQNGTKSLKVAVASKIWSGYIAILRPINQDKLGLDKSYRFAVGQNYITQVDLRVREGAGIDKRQKDRDELTEDGKKHALPGEKACLKADTEVTCLEIQEVENDIWIRIPSGWIAGYYDKKIYVK